MLAKVEVLSTTVRPCAGQEQVYPMQHLKNSDRRNKILICCMNSWQKQAAG